MTVAVGLAALLLFLSGLPGAIPAYRDGGDLASAAWTLGIAHPPGYPLYVLLSKLVSALIPFGNAAYRVNVFSALCGAVAAAFLFSALRRLTNALFFPPPNTGERFMKGGAVAAIAAVALWVSSAATLALCRVAEMYALAAAIGAGLLWFSIAAPGRVPTGGAFLLGLGMGAHPLLILMAPLVIRRLQAPVRRHVYTVLSFALGASVLLFLPVRAFQDPDQNWGNPVTWRLFWRMIMRADYGGLKLHPEQSVFAWSPSGVIEQLWRFVQGMAFEVGTLACLVALAGAYVLWRSPLWKGWAIRAIATFVLLGPGFYVLANLPWAEKTTPAILEPNRMLASLMLVPLLAAGVGVFMRNARPLALGLCIAAPVVALWRSEARTARWDLLAYDYGRNLLRSLPAGAVLYEPDDPTAFSLRALQTIEGRRRDVVLLNFFRTRWGYEQIRKRYPDLLPPVPLPSAQALEQALWTYSVKRRPFFAELPQKLGAIPHRAEGLVYRISLSPTGERASGAAAPSGEGGQQSLTRGETLLLLSIRRGPFVNTAYSDFFSKHILNYYAAAHSNLGLAYAQAGRPQDAERHYCEALRIDPDLSAAWNNRGILAYEARRFGAAIAFYERALASDPGNATLARNLELAQKQL